MNALNWGPAEWFNAALALLTALTLLYNYRAGNRARQREIEADERKSEIESRVNDRKQNFDEIQASLTAARADNAYLKQEAADARLQKAETERQSRERLVEVRNAYNVQLRTEREACSRAIRTFSTRLTKQMDPILPPDLRASLRATLESLHTELYEAHKDAEQFDRYTNDDNNDL